TLIEPGRGAIVPPVRDVSDGRRDSVEVLLALPARSASGGNRDDGKESARPRRWRAGQVTVQELAGHERSELAVLRHALTLRLSTEENAAFLTCPVARLVRDAQGQWIVDPEFIPPLLSLAASPTRGRERGGLLNPLHARRARPCALQPGNKARQAR
ncbi:type VI secretion system baseplate subunit TssK, partial [Staphylococcus aureus]|nr:type VI secretion system baseplate subunit TssK [Staphylococcus aureus]